MAQGRTLARGEPLERRILLAASAPGTLDAVSPPQSSIAVGDEFALTATARQLDASLGYKTVIDWGDGSTSAGTIGLGESSFAVGGAHGYGAAGIFHVSVLVDSDGGRMLVQTLAAGS